MLIHGDNSKLDYPVGDLVTGQRVLVSGSDQVLDVFASSPSGKPSATPVITAGAYAANDAVGGRMAFMLPSAGGREGSGLFYIQACLVSDLAKQDVALDLFLFDFPFTATADNAAFDIPDNEIKRCIGVISVSTYYDANDNSIGIRSGFMYPIVLAGDEPVIYGQLVTRGAPTYAATSDLTVNLVVSRA